MLRLWQWSHSSERDEFSGFNSYQHEFDQSEQDIFNNCCCKSEMAGPVMTNIDQTTLGVVSFDSASNFGLELVGQSCQTSLGALLQRPRFSLLLYI